jgi:hypothetical protein
MILEHHTFIFRFVTTARDELAKSSGILFKSCDLRKRQLIDYIRGFAHHIAGNYSAGE